MIDLLLVLFWLLVFYVVIFVPLNAAAHHDVFGCWPKRWQEWVFVWLEPRP